MIEETARHRKLKVSASSAPQSSSGSQKNRERDRNSKIHGSRYRPKGLETESKEGKETKALTSPQKAKRETRSRTLRRSLHSDSHRRVLFGLRPLPHGHQSRRIFENGKYRFLDERRLAAKLP